MDPGSSPSPHRRREKDRGSSAARDPGNGRWSRAQKNPTGSPIAARNRCGYQTLASAVERRACRRAHHATVAREWRPLSGHQCSDAVVGSHRERLRRADLDDVQAGIGTEGACAHRASKAVLSCTPTRSSAPRPITATGEESEHAIPFMKGYTVFNVEQIEGLPAALLREARSRHGFRAAHRACRRLFRSNRRECPFTAASRACYVPSH